MKKFVAFLTWMIFVLFATGVAAQTDPWWHPLNPQGASAGVGYGTVFPSLTSDTGTNPANGELFILLDATGASKPTLWVYDDTETAWVKVGQASASTIEFEGATDDAFETTLSVADPTADVTYTFRARLAGTYALLDEGLPPLSGPTVELPNREEAPSLNIAPRFKAWFRTAPVFTSTSTAVASAGLPVTCATTGTMQLWGPAIVGHGFELNLKGTQTTCAVTYAAATGMRFLTDATTNEGFELTQGIVDNSPGAFTVGTSPAFYMSVRFGVATVAETDMTYVGFRGVEAYDATSFATYNDYYVIGIGDLGDAGAGDFFTQSELAGAGIAAVDLAEADWADTEIHTLTVLVSATGVASAQIEGVAVADAGAFTFADATIVVPFMYSINDVTGAINEIDIVFWETGLQ